MIKNTFNLSRTLQLRLFITFFGVLTYSIVGVSMTIYYNQHLGAAITGGLLILSSVSSFIASLIGGNLSDKFGRRPIMLGSSFVGLIGGILAVVTNLPNQTPHPWFAYVGFFLINVSSSFESPADNAGVIDVSDESNRSFIYSMQYWLINIAVMAGAGISAAFFRDYFSQLLFVLLFGQFINLAIKYWGIPESHIPNKDSVHHKQNILKSYKEVMKDKAFLFYTLGSVFGMMLFGNVDYYLPVHLTKHFHTIYLFGLEIYGQRMLSIFVGLNTLIIVLFMNFVTVKMEKVKRKDAMMLGMILQGVGFIFATLLHSFWPIVITCIVSTIGEMVIVPASQTVRADLMEGEKVGTYAGFFMMANPMSTILNGLVLSSSVFLGDFGVACVIFVVTALGAFLYSLVFKERTDFQ